MKYLLIAAFLLPGICLTAQQPASVIPAQALMVAQFNPGPVAADAQLQQQLHEQMFGSGAPFARMSRYVEGTTSLEGPQRDSLFAFLKLVAINPVNAGISATQPMFNYFDERDTLEVTAFVFVLDNKDRFLDWSAAHLFPGAAKLERIAANSFTYILHEHIAVATDGRFGWVFLPNYYHTNTLTDRNYEYGEVVEAIAEPVYENEQQLKLRLLVDSIRMADSMMAVEVAMKDAIQYKEIYRRDSAYDAAENAFYEKLNGRNFKMRDSIANAVMKDRELRRRKKQTIESSLDVEVEEKIDALRDEYIDKHVPDALKRKETGNNYPRTEEIMVMDIPPHEENMQGVSVMVEGENAPDEIVEPSRDVTLDESLLNYYSLTRAENNKRDSLVNRNFVAYLNELSRLAPSQSIGAEPHFAAAAKQQFDAVYYFSYSRMIQQEWMREVNRRSYYDFYDSDGTMNRVERKKKKMHIADSLFRASVWYGAGFTGGVRFNGSEMKLTQQFFFNNEVTELTKGLFKGKVDKGLLRYVKTNPYSVMGVSASPEKVVRLSSRAYREYMQLMMYSSMYGSGEFMLAHLTSLYRVFLDEDVMYNLFSGDAVFALTDLVPRTRTYTTYDYDDNFQYRMVEKTETQLMPEFVFAAKIGRKDKMRDIIEIGVRANVIFPYKNYYVLREVPREFGIIYIAFQKGVFVITNDSILANDYISKGYSRSKALNRRERRDMRKSPVTGWWDAERTRLTMQQRGQYQERSGRRSERVAKITNRVMFRGRRGSGGSNQIEFSAVFTDDGLPDYGYIRILRMMRLMQNLDRSF
ncbi:MAG: hypothetical protein MUC87_18670 [Bacteroidia bacterium]|jgi:hypothetical protein|nr:hypothetical protein [Bacteroidia bacterium]